VNLNRTKIEWTDYSWNPETGCNHGCWYCYAKKLCLRFKKIFPNGFKPTFYPERLKEPWELKKPSKIFVCSIADLFASWTPIVWRDAILDSIFQCPIKHIFQLLTKNPERIPKIHFLDNVWVGTTVTSENNDAKNIDEIKKVHAKVRFVSFEPLLGYIDLRHKYCLDGIQWVIVGKLTGSKKVKLDWDWFVEIYEECKVHKIPLFMKKNLGCIEQIQEFPKVNGGVK
jgi:protein gp37